MGWSFSNVHIRKSETATEAALVDELHSFMAEQGLMPAEDAEEADASIAILTDEKQAWFTLCSEELSFQTPEQFQAFGRQFSDALRTDVLGIVCLDSDYLYLNLVNTADGTDAWLDVGVFPIPEIDLGRQTDFAAWAKKAKEPALFRRCAEKDYVFAEEFLDEAEACLDLYDPNNKADPLYLEENPEAAAKVLYYKS